MKKIRELKHIKQLLIDLNVSEGDTIWLSVDLLGIGYFSKNRILLTRKYLKKNDIVINQIIIKRKNRLNESFIKRKIANLIKKKKFNILNYNVFGLSNTAIKSKYVKTVIDKVNKNIKIFDWFFGFY